MKNSRLLKMTLLSAAFTLAIAFTQTASAQDATPLKKEEKKEKHADNRPEGHDRRDVKLEKKDGIKGDKKENRKDKKGEKRDDKRLKKENNGQKPEEKSTEASQ